MIVIVLMFMILGLIIFNYNHNIDALNMAYLIVGVTFVSILLLTLTYNSHPECDALINHNNQTLQFLQDKCYQYINF
jgi:hypothetical protein